MASVRVLCLEVVIKEESGQVSAGGDPEILSAELGLARDVVVGVEALFNRRGDRDSEQHDIADEVEVDIDGSADI